MLIKDVISFLNDLCPEDSAESFDNPGLLVGSKNKELISCVVCLDVTNKVIDEAISSGANFIISHHPLIFGGINSVNADDVYGRLIIRMIENGISYYAMHTNLDKKHDLSNKVLADTIGVSDVYTLEEVAYGVFGTVPANSTIKDFKEQVNKALGNNGVISVNDDALPVTKAYIQGGAFDEENIGAIVANGVDVVVSGEIKHHITLLLGEMGICSVIAGHKATEDVFMPALTETLINKFPEVKFLLSF